MMTFSQIALAFLHEHGLEPAICGTEEEARSFFGDVTRECVKREPEDGDTTSSHSSLVTRHSPPYPVYFFQSDTSGEKAYEEFFTVGEEVDFDTYRSLGVIKNAPKRPIEEIREVISLLEETLSRQGITKSEIVAVITKLVPGFDHIETGKSLDSKM